MINRDWPTIEKEAVEDDAYLNALGCVPPPLKVMFICLLYVLGPFIVVPEIKNKFDKWRRYRRLEKSFRNIKQLVDRVIAEGDSDRTTYLFLTSKLNELEKAVDIELERKKNGG
jgi:hypothetical protein